MLKHSLAIATCLAFSSSVMGNEANLLYTNTMQFPYKHNADGYMVFDIHGKLVVPPEGHFDTLNYMAERWLAFSGENLYIYDESGKLIIKRTGQDPVYLGGDLLSIRVDTGKRILINNNGVNLSENTFDDIRPFNPDIAVAKIGVYDKHKKIDYRYGYINTHGEWVIPATYTAASDFNNGFAVVSRDEKQIINASGDITTIVPNKIKMEPLNNGYWLKTFLKNSKGKQISISNEIIKNKDEVVVKNVNPVLVAKDSFYLSGAYKNEYYGLLNTDSGTVIPKLKTSDFDKANDTISYIANISNGDLFWLKRRYSYRLYNSQGLMQLEGYYNDVKPFYGDHAWVVLPNESNWVLIDYFGNVVSEAWGKIETIAYGNNIITYAYKDDDDRTMYILDSSGDVDYIERKYDIWQERKCDKTISVLYDDKNRVIWPKDPLIECLNGLD
ncbi:WG repeat-containing protein [Klebsiella pneumoniae]|uniref:WG repeat-containing protein n=1 Tax=Klebsiella pneumoniae TaxID=573 RepID=UPI00209BFB61|nr:WG repeat-containing protein [Klebsiella pneumoniae]